MIKKSSLFYFLLLLQLPIYPQNPEWIHYYYNQYVDALAIKGDIVWVGTDFGIIKYNKKTGEKLFFDTINSGFAIGRVNSIVTDNKGNAWFGTIGNGLLKYNGSVWTSYNTTNSNLPNDRIYSLAVDKQDVIWIGAGDNLVRFDGTYWNIYKSSGLVEFISIDYNGNKWVTQGYGNLAKFDGTNWTLYKNNSGLYPGSIISFFVDMIGNVWFGFRKEDPPAPTPIGLVKFDGTNWTVYNTSNSGLPGNGVYSITEDKSGNMLFCTNGGIVKFDGTNWTKIVANLKTSPHAMVALTLDSDDNIWFGTENGFFVGMNGNISSEYSINNSGLTSNEVSCIAIDEKDNKWIGTNQRLTKFDGINWNSYSFFDSTKTNYAISTLTIDKDGSKWIGTNGNGLIKLNDKNTTYYDTSNSGLPSMYVRSIEIDNNNKWIATYGGLVKFDGTNWTVYNKSNSGLPNNYVYCLKIDKDDNKWLGFSNSYLLVKFDGINWKSYNLGGPSTIRSIAIDENGIIWLEDDISLFKFDGINSNGFNVFKENLHGNIHSITTDQNNNVWIGTSNSGLVKFDGQNCTYYNNGTGASSFAFDKKGNMWMGNRGGVVVFREGGIITSVKEEKNKTLPIQFSLSQNYPNPFNPSTVIRYQISAASHVTLKVYDMLGREVATLVDEYKQPGSYNCEFRIENKELPSGIYFYRIQAGSFSETKKFVLMK